MMRIGNVGLMLALGIHPSDLEDAWLEAEQEAGQEAEETPSSEDD